MNYYEQFYDDLELKDQDVQDEFDARNYRQQPYSKNENKQNRGRGDGGQNRGGRGQNRGRGDGGQNWGGRGQNRGRGNNNRGGGQRGGKPDQGPGGKMKKSWMTNFVKAGELTPVTDQPVVTYPTANQSNQQANNGQANQQPAGGIGYGVFMPLAQQQQQENNMNYSNPQYGYGEGSDFSTYGYPNQAEGQGQAQSMYPQGYQQPGQEGYQQPGQEGYQQPGQEGYQQPGQEGYQQPGQEGYQQPGQEGYQQPGPDGYQQPSQQASQDGSMYPAGYDPSYQYNTGMYPGYENQQWAGYDGYNYWPQQQQETDTTQHNTQQTPSNEAPPPPAVEVPDHYRDYPGAKPQVKKKPMVIPSMNFVKSTSEFKSTDLVAKRGLPAQVIEAVPKSGDKRAGLGFGKVDVPIQSGAGEAFDIAAQDLKFVKLVESVKARNAPNKNAVEVLHISIQKLKGVALDFDISPCMSGMDNFTCIVTINGIHIGKASDGKKKGAKTKACAEAVSLLTCGKPLTVRKSSSGHYELKPKVVDVIHPPTVSEIGPSPCKKGYTPSQGGVVTTNKNPGFAAKSAPPTSQSPATTAAASAAYNKPKIVFHAASSSKPLAGFVKEGQAPSETSSMQDVSKTQPMAQVTAGKKRKAGGTPVNQRNVNDLSKFILMKTVQAGTNNAAFLAQSADFNRTSVSYEFDPDPEGYECSVGLGGNAVGSGTGPTKDEAKKAAVDEAVEFLQDICYTIVVKVVTGYDANADKVSLSELEGGVSDEALPSSNIGNALLRKMGWAGGGMGKHGKGISEPIKADNVIGRKGLGLVSGSEKNFTQKVKKLLDDFARSNTDNELHFSPELSKEERAKIHQMAQKLHLKTVSRGKDENRYLTISKKRSLQELLNHVIESGGVTDKYEILSPKNPNITYDVCRRDAGGYSHSKQ